MEGALVLLLSDIENESRLIEMHMKLGRERKDQTWQWMNQQGTRLNNVILQLSLTVDNMWTSVLQFWHCPHAHKDSHDVSLPSLQQRTRRTFDRSCTFLLLKVWHANHVNLKSI